MLFPGTWSKVAAYMYTCLKLYLLLTNSKQQKQCKILKLVIILSSVNFCVNQKTWPEHNPSYIMIMASFSVTHGLEQQFKPIY